MLTTAEAAEQLHLTPRSVARLCKRGVIKGELKGRDWQVDQESVEEYKASPRKPGRKKKEHENTSVH